LANYIRQEIANVIPDVEQFGLSLGPSHERAGELHAGIAALNQGNADGARQLEIVLGELVDSTKDMTAAQQRQFATVFSELNKLKDTLKGHRAALDTLYRQ
jgi:uncharacterized protein involved in exopolysaccharide biosynthesis